MFRNLLIGASVGIALAIAFTVAWQPMHAALAESSAAPERSQPVKEQADRSLPAEDERGPSGRPGGEREITPELIERVIDVAREVDEVTAQRLRTLCDEYSPAEVERFLRTEGRRLVALADLKSRDPELYDVKIRELQSEAHIAFLASQIATARLAGDETRLAALRDEMLGSMRLHVAMSLAARRVYLKRLEEHVEALKIEFERDTMNFEQTVERRIAEVIEQALSEAEGSVARSR